MSNKSDAILEVRDLRISFRTNGEWKQVLHGLSYDVFAGRTLGLVGESGSGKTVSSLACLGLLPEETARIDEGTVMFNGVDLLHNSFEEARKQRGCGIAMVFQEPMSSLNPSMRVGEQVAEVMKLHLNISSKEAERRVVELFREVDLPQPETIGKRYPHELSGGQKQRVVIAIALAGNPKIIIADEPTTALDVTVQRAVIDLLKRLQEERGLGLVFISHDLDVVGAIADDLVVLQQGAVMEEGDAKTVLAKPNSDYTKKLISSKPPVRGPRAPLAVDSAEPYQINILEDPILEVRGIRKKFITNRNIFGKPIAYFEAVKGVSFTLNRGESIGIVGESGCGKSTVSKMIIGLEKPDEGAITFRDGRPPIQLVFQDPYASLNPRLTVRQMLREALLTAGSVQEREVPQQIQKLLNEVGLSSDSQERYPHSFSGGQRQRLVIARALAANPSILILDESVAALDVSVQAQVLNLLFQIRLDRGLSYIFISHDLHVVRHMCERVVVMEKGEIVEEGSSDAVLQQPQHPYTRRLLNSIYSLNQ